MAQWLICMWTRAFTLILTETVAACHCVAWFPSMHRGAVKNWKRWQICYPSLRIPMKQPLFMYYTETFKIIGSFFSTLFRPSHTYTHSLFGPLKEKSSNYYAIFLCTIKLNFWQGGLSLLFNQWHLLMTAKWIRQIATSRLWWKGVCEAAKRKCTCTIAAFNNFAIVSLAYHVI